MTQTLWHNYATLLTVAVLQKYDLGTESLSSLGELPYESVQWLISLGISPRAAFLRSTKVKEQCMKYDVFPQSMA
jgi:hypothetical protein